MEIDVVLVRAGMTEAESQGRYIGVTDEPLCEQGEASIMKRVKDGHYPAVDRAFSASPLRCRQTAALAYSGKPIVIIEGLAPFHYGVFENRSYGEIEADARFAKWAFAKEAGAFAEGESPFRQIYRNVAAFREIMSECEEQGIGRAAIVADRLTVQAVLRRYLVPRSSYRSFGIDFGGGAVLRYNSYRKLASLIKIS